MEQQFFTLPVTSACCWCSRFLCFAIYTQTSCCRYGFKFSLQIETLREFFSLKFEFHDDSTRLFFQHNVPSFADVSSQHPEKCVQDRIYFPFLHYWATSCFDKWFLEWIFYCFCVDERTIGFDALIEFFLSSISLSHNIFFKRNRFFFFP